MGYGTRVAPRPPHALPTTSRRSPQTPHKIDSAFSAHTTPFPNRDLRDPRVAPGQTARRLLMSVRRTAGRSGPASRDPFRHRPLQFVCKPGLLRSSTGATGSLRGRRPVAQRGRMATLHPHLGTTLWIVAPRPVDGRARDGGQLPSETGTTLEQHGPAATCPPRRRSVPAPSAGSVPRQPHRTTCDDVLHPHCAQDLSLRLYLSPSKNYRETTRWTGTPTRPPMGGR